MRKQDRKQAIADYQTKRDELERITRRDRAETDDYHQANQAVAEAAKNVPFWRR